MLDEQTVFKPNEIQIGRHYWFELDYEGVSVLCIIKVQGLVGEVVEGRILDTEGLSMFCSRFADEEMNEESGEDLAPEIRVEHLMREATTADLRFLLNLIESSTQDFFSTLPLRQEDWGPDVSHRTLH